METFDLAVVGAGPVGLIAALRAARSGRKVVVVAKRFPAAGDPPRVDAAPASFLAFLVDLGLHPARIGADRIHTRRFSAWASREPRMTEGPETVHIDRPALDLALLEALRRCGNASTVLGQYRPGRDITGDGWRARDLIDASGRAAASAEKRIAPDRPWVARTFWLDRSSCAAAADFAIAALPDGYAYRLGSASRLTFGIVGRGTALMGNASDVWRRVRDLAPWILEGLPRLQNMSEGSAKPASVQWTEGHGRLCIGDAALARDALSSQGIATGTSDALLAAAAATASDLDLIRLRQEEQRRAHLRSILGAIDQAIHRESPKWRDYRAFIVAHLGSGSTAATVALRDGRIARVSAHATSTE